MFYLYPRLSYKQRHVSVLVIMTTWLSWTQIIELTYIKRNHIQISNIRKQTGIRSGKKWKTNRNYFLVVCQQSAVY